jgi:hypothetical protein
MGKQRNAWRFLVTNAEIENLLLRPKRIWDFKKKKKDGRV